uniref:Putative ovule protein n=1 Tax=Solanum chacoense TaxID=4108 RepID=A0A0V0HCP2_SOLCH
MLYTVEMVFVRNVLVMGSSGGNGFLQEYMVNAVYSRNGLLQEYRANAVYSRNLWSGLSPDSTNIEIWCTRLSFAEGISVLGKILCMLTHFVCLSTSFNVRPTIINDVIIFSSLNTSLIFDFLKSCPTLHLQFYP